MTGLVDRMERQGPRPTRRGRRDRRSIELEATPAGALALREHARGIEAIARRHARGAAERDQRALVAILRRAWPASTARNTNHSSNETIQGGRRR